MQEVDLPVINNTMCESMYRDAGYVEHIPEIFICAGYAVGGKDSCEVISSIFSLSFSRYCKRRLYNRQFGLFASCILRSKFEKLMSIF